jgi:hypothetical protein
MELTQWGIPQWWEVACPQLGGSPSTKNDNNDDGDDDNDDIDDDNDNDGDDDNDDDDIKLNGLHQRGYKYYSPH